MTLLERVHEGYVAGRRERVLAAHIARELPRGASVLEIGAGSGALLRRLGDLRPDAAFRGIDVLVRGASAFPIEGFDGRRVPFEAESFDAVVLVDVLHHTDDPLVLLNEASRVSRRTIVVKDHRLDGPLAFARLRFMDRVGNARFGVSLPFNYWPERRWRGAFAALDLEVASWRTDLGLYAWPARWVFEHSLHFLARLEKRD